jgi:hypothetical protein
MRSLSPILTILLVVPAALRAQEPINIGSRLELLVDDALIAAMRGGARLQLHQPTRREVVFRSDAPWEGNASAYQSIVKDGGLYRIYYRGLHYRHGGTPAEALADHPWYLCVAESRDGLRWERPEVGLFEFNGSKANNIVMTPESLAEIKGDPAHSATFLDSNPACPPEERYKTIILGYGPEPGLYVLVSPDGYRWSLKSTTPCVTEGAFDSQNLAFWDPAIQSYREYHRGFRDGVRDILTATSPDVTQFPAPQWLSYPDAPREHLYTNQIGPYYRAPHILMGFPMRYTDRGWSLPALDWPGLEERLARAAHHPRYGTTVTDGVFMTSRDGVTFRRWPEAFIRPGPRREGSWVYGDNFIFWGMIETPSDLGDAPNEISLYATEGYWEGVTTAFRRYTLRVDGFVSAAAPRSGGEIVTKPLVFDGGNLALNVETSGAGGVEVEVQDAAGDPLPGYELEACPEIRDDSLAHIVRWEGGGDVRPLAGRPVRLRFVLRDADLYAFQFVPYQPEPEYPEAAKVGALPPRNPNRGAFVILEDDFTGVPAGTSPTEDDLDPALAAAGASGWRVGEGEPDRVQVINGDPPGSGRAGAAPYLRVERRDETMEQGGVAWVVLSPQDVADSARGLVELSARIWVPSTNHSRVEIDGYGDEPGAWELRAFHVRLAGDGVVTYYREQENPIPGLTCPPDTWQDVRLLADLAAGTFSLTIGGKTVTGLPFGVDGVRRLRCLTIGPNSGGAALLVSSVKVTARPR